jgi:glycosyltransferase involved in cell wall biosynthesis
VHILLVSPRLPLPTGKGDQLRAFQLIQSISRSHSVEVVTSQAGAHGVTGEGLFPRGVTTWVCDPPRALRAWEALRALLRGEPAQVGWMMPRSAWRLVCRRASSADVVVAITVRALRGPVPLPLIIDHVDVLSVNMRRRASGSEPVPIRWLARLEAPLLARWERKLRHYAAAQLVVSPAEARSLPNPPEVRVVPNFVDVPQEPVSGRDVRDIDVILTGNMAYPPNTDAARWLSEEIAPALWARRPNTSVWVVGRGAGALSVDSRIQVRADVPHMGEYLRRAKVAIAPLRIGTGSPNKVLEAIAAGAAVVATPAAVEAFELLVGVVETADSAQALAVATERLLAAETKRSTMVDQARRLVDSYRPEVQESRLDAILTEVARLQDSGLARRA